MFYFQKKDEYKVYKSAKQENFGPNRWMKGFSRLNFLFLINRMAGNGFFL